MGQRGVKVRVRILKLNSVTRMVVSVPLLFSKSITQVTTFWKLGIGLGLLEIRVILRGKLGFYGRIRVFEKWSWRREE